jgi:hypothetical protein
VEANAGFSPGDAADVEFSGESTRSHGSRKAFSTAGERVFAVCYNRVKMSRKSVSDAVLERENVWKLFTDQRTSVWGKKSAWARPTLSLRIG